MRSKVKAALLAVTLLMGAAAAFWGGCWVPQLEERRQEQSSYEDLAREHVTIVEEDSLSSSKTAPDRSNPPSETSQSRAGKTSGLQVDFASLQAQNPDIVAWLYLPGAGISYPVVQAGDNDAYLRRSFTGEQSVAGTPFLDFANSMDFSDGNSIIHGHNMFDGSDAMFSALPRYAGTEYWRENPDIFLLTPDGGEKVYRIFAVCRFDVSSGSAAASYYRQDFRSADAQTQYIQNLLDCSVIQTGETVPAGCTLLTLSTCDRQIYGGNGRIVIVGYQIN